MKVTSKDEYLNTKVDMYFLFKIGLNEHLFRYLLAFAEATHIYDNKNEYGVRLGQVMLFGWVRPNLK